MAGACGCKPSCGKYDPLSEVLSRELDDNYERRRAHDWALEARKYAEAAQSAQEHFDAGIEDAEEAAQRAAASAGEAAGSVEAAKGQAQAAEQSATQAQGFADNAEQSAQAADKSKADAEKSADEAKVAQQGAESAKADAERAMDAAKGSETNAEKWAKTAQSYAVGEGLGEEREGESTDNAKYYAQQAADSKAAAQSSAGSAADSATAASQSETAATKAQTQAQAGMEAAQKSAAEAKDSAEQAGSARDAAQAVADKLADVVGGDVVTSEELAAAVEAHNQAPDAHSDIRTEIDTDIEAHNQATDAHSDIRTEIDTDIEEHNQATDAHSDIRTEIDTDIEAHNQAPEAHSDIRGLITAATSSLRDDDIFTHEMTMKYEEFTIEQTEYYTTVNRTVYTAEKNCFAFFVFHFRNHESYKYCNILINGQNVFGCGSAFGIDPFPWSTDCAFIPAFLKAGSTVEVATQTAEPGNTAVDMQCTVM